MKLSICCITYNHAYYISRTIDSFLQQQIDFDYEIIISDDASTDGTQKIIQYYQIRHAGLIKVIYNQNNIGVWENFTQCLLAAQGEYISYCDGDDYFIYPTKIKEQVEALEQNESCSFSFHHVDLVDENGNFLRHHSAGRISRKFQTGVINNRTVAGSPLLVAHANSLVFRKSALEKKYFSSLKGCTGGDYQLLVLLCKHGDGYFINKAMSAYCVNSGSISNARRMSLNTLREIKQTHIVMNIYFNNIFTKELRNNYKGHRMHYYEGKFMEYFNNKIYFKAIYYYMLMLFHHMGSQYSLADVLWILKNKIRNVHNDLPINIARN